MQGHSAVFARCEQTPSAEVVFPPPEPRRAVVPKLHNCSAVTFTWLLASRDWMPIPVSSVSRAPNATAIASTWCGRSGQPHARSSLREAKSAKRRSESPSVSSHARCSSSVRGVIHASLQTSPRVHELRTGTGHSRRPTHPAWCQRGR